MIKYIIIGFGAVLGLFLIYKLIKTPELYKKWAAYNKIRLVLLIIALSISGIVVLIYQYGSNKNISKGETLNIIRNLDINEVSSIKLYSYSKSFFTNYSKDTVIIYDKSFINQLSTELKRLTSFEYGTPIPEWKMNIQIALKNDLLNNIRLEVIKKEDGKCAVWIIKESWLGEFNLGKYSNDDLGKLIEKFHNQESDTSKL